MPIPPDQSPGHGLPSLQAFHRIETQQFDLEEFSAFCRALARSPRLANLIGGRAEDPNQWLVLAALREHEMEGYASVLMLTDRDLAFRVNDD